MPKRQCSRPPWGPCLIHVPPAASSVQWGPGEPAPGSPRLTTSPPVDNDWSRRQAPCMDAACPAPWRVPVHWGRGLDQRLPHPPSRASVSASASQLVAVPGPWSCGRARERLGSRCPSHLLAQGLSSLTGTSLSSVPEACSAGLEERGKEQRVRPSCAATPAAELGRFLSPAVWQGPLQTPATWVPSLTP